MHSLEMMFASKSNRMKRVLITVAYLIISPVFFAHAQEAKPLDGKTYMIQMYVGKEKDSGQNLSFDGGTMLFSDAEKYGFSTEEYKCKQKNDSTFTFVSVSKSQKNGTMTWEGKVMNDRIEGTCIWTRL